MSTLIRTMEFGCIALLRVEFIGKGVLFDGKENGCWARYLTGKTWEMDIWTAALEERNP
jgi:hypothetical protein